MAMRPRYRDNTTAPAHTASPAHGYSLVSPGVVAGRGASPVAFHYDCDECRRLIAARDPRQLGIAQIAATTCDDSPESGGKGTR